MMKHYPRLIKVICDTRVTKIYDTSIEHNTQLIVTDDYILKYTNSGIEYILDNKAREPLFIY